MHFFDRFGLKIFVHEVEHGHVEQFLSPDIRLMLLIYLHVGDILRCYLYFRRMRWTPKNGAQQFFDEGRAGKHAAYFRPSHRVLVSYWCQPLSSGNTSCLLFSKVSGLGTPIHTETV